MSRYPDTFAPPSGTSPKKRRGPLAVLVLAALAIIVLAGGWKVFTEMLETVDAGEYVVKQSVFGGSLVVWDDSGPHWQLWGKCTHYPLSKPFNFEAPKDHRTRAVQARDPNAHADDKALKTKFRDGAEGWISGSLRYEMPLGYNDRIALHKQFGSAQAVEHDLVRTVIENAVFVSGRFMTSSQSFAEKRADLAVYIEQQAKLGKLGSIEECADVEDTSTKTKKNVCETHVAMKDGQPVIVEKSPVADYNVKLTNFNFNGIRYEDNIQQQMDDQQQAMAAVKTAEANAKKAIQDTITTEQSGRAQAAKAEWEQKTVSAKLIAEAEQKKTVAQLSKEAAEFKKQEDILLGEGEAARRKLVMAADGALEQNLKTKLEINRVWAEAYSKVRPTADVSIGGGGNATESLGTLLMLSQLRQNGLLPAATHK